MLYAPCAPRGTAATSLGTTTFGGLQDSVQRASSPRRTKKISAAAICTVSPSISGVIHGEKPARTRATCAGVGEAALSDALTVAAVVACGAGPPLGPPARVP